MRKKKNYGWLVGGVIAIFVSILVFGLIYPCTWFKTDAPTCKEGTDFSKEYPDLYEYHHSFHLKCSNIAGWDSCSFSKFINPLYNWNLFVIGILTIIGGFVGYKIIK